MLSRDTNILPFDEKLTGHAFKFRQKGYVKTYRYLLREIIRFINFYVIFTKNFMLTS